jgi:hypothetical protein
MGALEKLREQHKKSYTDIPFDEFVHLFHQKFYPDMSFEDYSKKIEYSGPGYEPVTVRGVGGEPMAPTEAMMGVVPTKGVEEVWPEIGATVGGMALGIPGAAAGGALGEAGREYVAGEGISPKKIVTEGGIQGGIEALARGGTKVLGKILAPSAGKISPETIEAAESFKRFGGELSPAQAVEGKLIDLAEGVSEASMTGGPKFFKFREGQARAFESMADDLAERVGTSLSDYEVGTLFADAIEKSDRVFRTQAKALYKNVDSLTSGAGVDLRPLKEFAGEQLETALTREGIGGSAAGDQLIKKVAKLGDFVSFEEASAIRSGLGEEISSFLGRKDKAAGISKKFFSMTNEAMEESAKNLGDEAFTAWKKANSFYKEGKSTFQSKFMRNLLGLVEDSASRRGAEAISSQIFKPGKETAIREVKRALKGKPNVWDKLRGSYLSRVLHNATNADGVLLGRSFTKEIEKMGEKTLTEIFTAQEMKDIRNLAKVGRLSQARPVGGGSMLIQLTQAGAVVGLVAGKFEKTAASVLLGPYAMAHLMTTPGGIKWLTTGLKTPAATKDSAAIAGRIITEAIRSGGGEDIQIQPY